MTEMKNKKMTDKTASKKRHVVNKTRAGLSIKTGIRAGSVDDYGFTSCMIR